MMSRRLRWDDSGSGDIGVIMLAVIIMVSIFALEFSFGYDEVTDRFNVPERHDAEFNMGWGENDTWQWYDFLLFPFRLAYGVATYTTDIAQNFLQDAAILVGIFWDLMTFNLGPFDELGVIRIFLGIPLWVLMAYTILKVLRGF